MSTPPTFDPNDIPLQPVPGDGSTSSPPPAASNTGDVLAAPKPDDMALGYGGYMPNPDRYEAPVDPDDTEEIERRSRARRLPNLNEVDPSLITRSPSYLESMKRLRTEDGVFSNLDRWLDKHYDSIQDENPEQAMKIRDSMPELMKGLAEGDREYLESFNTFEAAEREAARLKESYYWDTLHDNTSTAQALITGIGGFILDPINLVPGAAIYKGARAMQKVPALAKFGKKSAAYLGSPALVNKSASWAVGGALEEVIRNYPRFKGDVRFEHEQYVTAVATAAAFGGAMPFVKPVAARSMPPVAKAAGRAVEKAGEAYRNSASAQAAALNMRAAAKVAREMDLKSAKAIAKTEYGNDFQAAKASIRESMRRDMYSIKDGFQPKLWRDRIVDAAKNKSIYGVYKGVTGFTGHIQKNLVASGVEAATARKIVQAAQKELDVNMSSWADRMIKKKAQAVIDKGKRQLAEGDELGAASPVKDSTTTSAAVDAAQFGADSVGAAKRGTLTAAEKLEDLKLDMRETIQGARMVIDEYSKFGQRLLNDLPDNVTAEARRNIAYALDSANKSMMDQVNSIAARKGIRAKKGKPVSGKTPNQQMQEVMGKVDPVISGIRNEFKDTFNEIMKFSGLNPKNNAISREKMERMNRKMYDKAFYDAAKEINPSITTDNPLATFRETYNNATPAQQEKMLDKVTSRWQSQNAKFKEDASLEGWSTDTLERMNAAIDKQMNEVQSQLDYLSAVQRNPEADVLFIKENYQMISDSFENSAMPELLRKQYVDDKLQHAIKNQFLSLTESLSTHNFKSEIPLAQWFSMKMFETPSGYGGEAVSEPTVAILKDVLQNKAMRPFLKGYDDFQNAWAKEQNWTWGQQKKNYKGHSDGYQDIADMNIEVMREMNARSLGKPSVTESPAVKKFIDETYGPAYRDQHAGQLREGIDGITKDNEIPNYQRQVWNDTKILQIASTPQGREALHEIFEKGYISAGFPEAQAYELSRAMIGKKMEQLNSPPIGAHQQLGKERVQGAMPNIEEAIDHMRKNGSTDEAIEMVVDAINGGSDKLLPSYAKGRAALDYDATVQINGQDMRIVDLLDQDITGHFERYSMESSTLQAMSRIFDGEIKSWDDVEGFLGAIARQAHERGGHVNIRANRNAINMMAGRAYDGQLPSDLRKAKTQIQLASMGGLGESQLAEMGMALTRGIASLVGTQQTMSGRKARAKANRGIELSPMEKMDKGVLDDLASASGNYNDMYLLQRNNVVFDEVAPVPGATPNVGQRALDTFTGGKYRPALQSLQGRLTGFGKIRSFEDEINMSGTMTDMVNKVLTGKSSTSDARWKDMGADLTEGSWLSNNIKKYVEMDDAGSGRIQELNLNEWSYKDRDKLGVILERNNGRQIQKAFAGEQSIAMQQPLWAFAAQFRGYTITAAEKQQARHLKFADKEAAVGMTLNAATSALSRVARIYSLALSKPVEDREDFIAYKMESVGYETMKYMAMASVTPELTGMLNQAVGAPFGAHPHGEVRSVGDVVAAASYFERLMAAQGDGIPSTDAEAGRLQSLIALGTIFQANILFGIMRNAIYGGSDTVSDQQEYGRL